VLGGWSSASNTPFRLHKSWCMKGITTPLIVHWPKGIAARGELRNIRASDRCSSDDRPARGGAWPTTYGGKPGRQRPASASCRRSRRRAVKHEYCGVSRAEPRHPHRRLEAVCDHSQPWNV